MKEEIKALIAEKISGQGTAVDVGGALASILNALADAGGEEPIIAFGTVNGDGTFTITDRPEELNQLGHKISKLFKSGRPIFLEEDGNPLVERVVGYDEYNQTYITASWTCRDEII